MSAGGDVDWDLCGKDFVSSSVVSLGDEEAASQSEDVFRSTSELVSRPEE